MVALCKPLWVNRIEWRSRTGMGLREWISSAIWLQRPNRNRHWADERQLEKNPIVHGMRHWWACKRHPKTQSRKMTIFSVSYPGLEMGLFIWHNTRGFIELWVDVKPLSQCQKMSFSAWQHLYRSAFGLSVHWASCLINFYFRCASAIS